MKIWLISIFENTPLDDNQNTRFNAITNEALSRGHDVTFWASTFKHNVKKQRYSETTTIDVSEKLRVKYLLSSAYRSNISFTRMLSHKKLASLYRRELEKVDELPDVIYIAYPPISLVYEVTKWAEKHEIPVIVDIIDPWPDSYRRKMKFLPKKAQDVLLSTTSKKVKYIFKTASAVCGIAEQRLSWAKTYFSDISRVEYFYPAVYLEEMQGTLSEIREKEKAQGKFSVIYAGSLESSYDIPTILKAAELLEKKEPEIEFVIAGRGLQKDIIEKYVTKHRNVRYIGRVPKDELMREYARADLGLIQHHKNATQTVTYKLFDLLGSGLPVMNSLESELNDIVLKNKVGLFNEPGNYEKLAENISYCFNNRNELKRMKERAVATTAELGDAKSVYGRVVNLIEEQHEFDRDSLSINNTPAVHS